MYNPGNQDPTIGLSLYESLYKAAAQERPHGTKRHVFEDRGRHIESAWKHMQRTGSSIVNWWDYHLGVAVGLTLPVDDKVI